MPRGYKGLFRNSFLGPITEGIEIFIPPSRLREPATANGEWFESLASNPEMLRVFAPGSAGEVWPTGAETWLLVLHEELLTKTPGTGLLLLEDSI